MVRVDLVKAEALDELAAFTIPVELHPLILDNAIQRLEPRQPAAPSSTLTPALLRKQRQRLALAWTEGDIDDATYERERARLKAREQALVHDIAASAPSLTRLQLAHSLARMSILRDFATDTGHVQSHFMWRFGGRFAAPKTLFSSFWRRSRQKEEKAGSCFAASGTLHMPWPQTILFSSGPRFGCSLMRSG